MYEFKVDGVVYDVHITDVKRSAEVLDGPNAGRSTAANMIRDVLGTFYNYAVSIDADEATYEEYDRLYEVLSAPVDYHMVEMPYGQGMKRFKAYVSKVEDELHDSRKEGNRWGGMTFQFIAMEPQRR